MQQRVDRARRIPQHDVAVAALLVHKAVMRMILLHSRQRLQRGFDLSQVALVARHKVEHLVTFGCFGEQRLGCLQRLRVLPVRVQLADVLELWLRRQESRVGCRSVHRE